MRKVVLKLTTIYYTFCDEESPNYEVALRPRAETEMSRN